MNFTEIADEIRQNKNLDIHIQSESKHVRKLVAQQGYQLDKLIRDPSEDVRAEVARQGYGLEQLRHDKSDWVKFAALEKLEQLHKHNAGYDICHRIEVGDSHFVVGHNPKAPAPYVTWQYFDDKNYYHNGHYFVEQDAAIVDLFKRAGEGLNLQAGHSLGLALLNEEDRSTLREESAREAVGYALSEFLDDGLYDMQTLIQDELFMARAIRLYDNIDHSHENEAFTESLENLLEEFPHLKIDPIPKDLSDPEPLRISPEEAALLNDLLKLPCDKCSEVYGPLGDNFDFTFSLANGLYACVELVPTYDLQNPNQLSDSQPHQIQVRLYDGFDTILCEEFVSGAERGSITGNFDLSHEGKKILTLSIQEDEKLRRVGNQFIFKTTTEDERYAQHNGEICTITRGLTAKECDVLCTGLMWNAEFPNGDILNVFDYELVPIREPERKPALSDLLKNAEQRQASDFQISHNAPARER